MIRYDPPTDAPQTVEPEASESSIGSEGTRINAELRNDDGKSLEPIPTDEEKEIDAIRSLLGARDRIITHLEKSGFVAATVNNGENHDLAALVNEDNNCIILLRNALVYDRHSTASVSITVQNGKCYWKFSLPAPTDGIIIENLLSDDKSISDHIVNNLESGVREILEHENTHLACMHSSTPWGKILFNKILTAALHEYEERTSGEEKLDVTLTKQMYKNYDPEIDITNAQFGAAVLITELRAFRHNVLSSTNVAIRAREIGMNIEEVLKPEELTHEEQKQKLVNQLRAWRAMLTQSGGYAVTLDASLDDAAQMIMEHGSLTLKHDIVVRYPDLDQKIRERGFLNNS